MTTTTTTKSQEHKLRELLWLRHGCSVAALYGDDGEMQCGHCLIDFKRASAEEIETAFTQIAWNKLNDSNHFSQQAVSSASCGTEASSKLEPKWHDK